MRCGGYSIQELGSIPKMVCDLSRGLISEVTKSIPEHQEECKVLGHACGTYLE